MLHQEQVNGALFGNGRSAAKALGVRLAVFLLTMFSGSPALLRTVYAQGNVRGIGDVHVGNSQPGILELSWDPPSETPLDYRVSWAPAGEDFPSENDDQGNAYPTSPAYTIAGLAEGVCYKVRLRARYGDGAGDWTQPVVSVVQVSPPTNTPTLVPTEAPTESPTLMPTEAPTNTPTLVPAETLTDTPTLMPTEAPTETPGSMSAEAPTDTPTLVPAKAFTETPGSMSTEAPTGTPTLMPTAVQTDTPTLVPTATPTCNPTPAISESVAQSDSGGICDRTLQVRNSIIGLLNSQNLGSLNIKHCSEVTDEYLTRIFQMDFTGGGYNGRLSSLRAGDFGGLTGLSDLVLQDNNLRELPADVFDGLSNLYILWMENNDLSSLPGGVFDDLTGLYTLSLHENELTSLPNGVFDRLSGLRQLAVSENNLSSLPGGIFAGLVNLTHLIVSNNDLTSLPDGIFSGLSHLQAVNFAGNRTDPFILRMGLERSGKRVVATVVEGAPFDLSITLSAQNGAPGRTTVTIRAG